MDGLHEGWLHVVAEVGVKSQNEAPDDAVLQLNKVPFGVAILARPLEALKQARHAGEAAQVLASVGVAGPHGHDSFPAG